MGVGRKTVDDWENERDGETAIPFVPDYRVSIPRVSGYNRKQFPNLLQWPIPHGAFKVILYAVRKPREEVQPRALLNFVNRFNVRPEIGSARRILPENESRRLDAGRVPWYAYRDNLPIARGYLVGFVGR